MKLVALGGAGAMGATAVRKASALNIFEDIVVADRDHAGAAALARTVGVRAQPIDVTDVAALHALLAEADLVINTVGPYYLFGPTVLRAAIDTRTHYVDICDDWEPTLSLLNLHTAAHAAGVTAIIGMGASPGVSNLLAALGADQLDTVHDICTAWPVDPPGAGVLTDADAALLRDDGQPSAAVVHWMQQLSGTVAVVRGGHVSHEPPLRPVRLRLPGGRTGTAYTVGHPEPVTLHRTLRPSGDVVNAMVLRRSTAAYLDVLRTDIDRDRIDIHTAARRLATPGGWTALRSAARTHRFESPGELPPFFAALTGTRGGERRRVLARLTPAGFPPGMAEATGVPLALGAAQIATGLATEPGVHPPDAVIDRDAFFAGLAAHLGIGLAECLVVESY
ncbi:saccharopine dehydrogenase family protein [Mycobacterium aquaticum]|uniref:Saccharopine dehydrogenase n=1 Tax=Mycobacterium aquaticum TaxID=1927124 RepID=A0A1X0A6M0_9MYCO|nr:saccharopine dehydrogenase NADP-binding domain-containing protein [Mycobacterium aquaticum]ORA25719.1 saccharopine dehydrogenase [Mycobacterium aquaticum]